MFISKSFFVSHAFVSFGAKGWSSEAFGFDDVFELCLKTLLRHLALFANSHYGHEFFFLNFLSFFQSRAGVTCLTAMAIPRLSKALWWWYVENLNENVVAIGTSRMRWSKVQKRINARKSACDCPNINPQTSEFRGARFRDLMLLPFCTSLLSRTWMYSCTSDRLQRGESEEKRRKAVICEISGVDHRGIKNLSAPIWFPGWRHCTVFSHLMQVSLLVLCKKSTLTVIVPYYWDQEKQTTFKHWPPGYQKWELAWHSMG